MKKRFSVSLFILFIFFTGCQTYDTGDDSMIYSITNSSTSYTEITSETATSEIPFSANSENIHSETTEVEISEVLVDTSDQINATTFQTEVLNVSEQTTAVITPKQITIPAKDTTNEEIFEESVEPETKFESKLGVVTLYKDQITKKYFIMLNVTPQKVYWNETENYNVTVDAPMDILVPAVFEEWLADAYGVVLYLSEYEGTLGDIKIDEKRITGMTYPQYWCRDYLFTIKDDAVRFDDYTDEMENYFSGFFVGNNIEWGKYHYPENPFEDGMRIENLDLYFETVKADYEELEALMATNPNSDFEISPLFTEQGSGVRFRAKINYIY